MTSDNTTDNEHAAALSAAFTSSVTHLEEQLNESERQTFYRRVANMTSGVTQTWMVEAAFRCAETNDPDMLTGADRDGILGAMLGTLRLTAAEYLTDGDRQRLQPGTVAKAMKQCAQIQELNLPPQPEGPITWTRLQAPEH